MALPTRTVDVLMSRANPESKVIPVDGAIPVTDLAIASEVSKRAALAQAVPQAGETSELFAIVGDGVDQAVIDRVYRVSKTFFALPRQEEKVAIRSGTPGLHLDGGRVAKSTDRDIPQDLTEVFG
jgi:isopenicillin N synthase-like dioxygenase